MKNLNYKHFIGVPIRSASYSSERAAAPRRLLSHPAAAQDHYDASHEILQIRQCRVNSVVSRMNSFTRGFREHVRLGPKLTETVKGKLSLGTRILQLGGVAKVFKQNFSVREEEKLLNSSQCYLSTTAGPIAGLLFISTHKVAFCSDRSIKILSPSGKFLRIRYKVAIPLQKIKQANASENVKKPSQKYIQVVTEDGFEFWFMGFLNSQKILRCLQQAITGGQ